jgi:hypothetical protein
LTDGTLEVKLDPKVWKILHTMMDAMQLMWAMMPIDPEEKKEDPTGAHKAMRNMMDELIRLR